jgi:hypothetical protein
MIQTGGSWCKTDSPDLENPTKTRRQNKQRVDSCACCLCTPRVRSLDHRCRSADYFQKEQLNLIKRGWNRQCLYCIFRGFALGLFSSLYCSRKECILSHHVVVVRWTSESSKSEKPIWHRTLKTFKNSWRTFG